MVRNTPTVFRRKKKKKKRKPGPTSGKKKCFVYNTSTVYNSMILAPHEQLTHSTPAGGSWGTARTAPHTCEPAAGGWRSCALRSRSRAHPPRCSASAQAARQRQWQNGSFQVSMSHLSLPSALLRPAKNIALQYTQTLLWRTFVGHGSGTSAAVSHTDRS